MQIVGSDTGVRLGRLCSSVDDAVHAAPAFPGIERIEAYFAGEAYIRHRHDTYALGITMRGVQTFWYRGQDRASLPGQIVVLHPDEVHDGGAGTDQGLLYRMLYVEPMLLQSALSSPAAGLPFVSDPVVDDVELRSALIGILGDMDGELEALAVDHFMAELADGLARHSAASAKRSSAPDARALMKVRAYLDASMSQIVRSGELEAICGLDRFAMTRQFKALFGTSPYRYLIMRRLTRARRLLAGGRPIADVAVATGFADQSHFHRVSREKCPNRR